MSGAKSRGWRWDRCRCAKFESTLRYALRLPATIAPNPVRLEVPAMRFLRLLLSGRSARLLTAGLFAAFALGGCAGWFGNNDPLHVSIAGLEPIASQGAEM